MPPEITAPVPTMPVVDTGKPVNPADNQPLASTLYPGGAENETGGGTVAAPADSLNPPAQPTPEGEKKEGDATEGDKAPEPKPDPPVEKDAQQAEGSLTVESYSALELPKDFTVDDKSMTSFKTLAAETGIAPEAAQKLLNLYGDTMKSYVEGIQAKQVKAWNDMTTGWTNELKALPELQGDRAARTREVVGQIIEEFGGPDKGAQLRQELTSTWMGDNPRLFKLIYDMGVALVEDEPITTGAPTGVESRRGKTLGQVLYPAPPTTN